MNNGPSLSVNSCSTLVLTFSLHLYTHSFKCTLKSLRIREQDLLCALPSRPGPNISLFLVYTIRRHSRDQDFPKFNTCRNTTSNVWILEKPKRLWKIVNASFTDDPMA